MKSADEIFNSRNTPDQRDSDNSQLAQDIQSKLQGIWAVIKANKPLYFLVVLGGIFLMFWIIAGIVGNKVSGLFLPEWVFILLKYILIGIALIVISSISNIVFGKTNRFAKRAFIFIIIFSVLVGIGGIMDMKKFDDNGDPTRWINMANGNMYKRTVNEVHKDAQGEYFFDPKTGDTCRPATQERLKAMKHVSDIPREVIYKWTTVYNKEYDSSNVTGDGLVYTDLKYYSFQRGDRVVIENVDKKNEVVKVALNAERTQWGYADNISGQYVVHITSPSPRTAEGVVTLQIIGSGKARVKLERNIPVTNSQGNS